TRGSFFTAADEASGTPVLVLSDDAAAAMFGDVDPIGLEVESVINAMSGLPAALDLPTVSFRVVGTFAPKATEGYEALSEPSAYFPIWSDGTGFMGGGAMTLSVLAKPGRGEQAREQVVAAARTVLTAEIARYDLDASVI